MSRLIVFGCSYAYGFALPDYNLDSSKPSKFAWPVFIASAMNRQLINKALPASSNKRIWYEITNFKFKPDDIVIISWSYGHRSCIIKSPRTIKNLINSHTDEKDSKVFYENIYSWYDSLVMFRLFIDNANRLLFEKNLIVYNLIVNSYWKKLLKKQHPIVPLYIEDYLKNYPLASDNAHLGLDANRAFASDFMKYIGVHHTLKDIPKPYSLFTRIKNKLCRQ